MKRRDLLAGLLPVAVASLARAQQPGKMSRIAIFHPTESHLAMSEQGGLSHWQALYQELRRLGYEEGRNLKVERYSGVGQEEETYPQLAKQVVATQLDLIFSWGGQAAYFAEAAAERVPILTFVTDPVAAGLSTSLSRPSANVTGIVADVSAVVGKRFEMLREVRPGVNHVAMLVPRSFWEVAQDTPNSRARQMAQQSGLRLTCMCLASPVQEAAFRQAFANVDQDRPDFILVQDGGENFTHRELIVDLVNKKSIPALYPVRAFVESGGLISYGYDPDDLFRHLARQMAAILRGQPVSEVPFYLPMKWELAVNLKTAKALGLEIPQSILARADLVIE
jgi:ABC-type uncharacterized transport system substrate-binding protein